MKFALFSFSSPEIILGPSLLFFLGLAVVSAPFLLTAGVLSISRNRYTWPWAVVVATVYSLVLVFIEADLFPFLVFLLPSGLAMWLYVAKRSYEESKGNLAAIFTWLLYGAYFNLVMSAVLFVWYLIAL